MKILEIKNLNLKINGKNILQNLNISFENGRIHAVIGPNGAGKSTLAYTIMGLEGYRSYTGEILFENSDLRNLKINERSEKGITLAWQDPARFEGLTVKNYISLGKKIKTENDINDILSKLNLEPEEYLNRPVDKTLSGGERKKIELASILAMETKVVILDEPDSGIDIESLEKIFESIKLLKKRNTTVILITHSIAVLKQAEYASLMCHGTIIDEGPVKKILPYFEKKCIICPHKNLPDKSKIDGRK